MSPTLRQRPGAFVLVLLLFLAGCSEPVNEGAMQGTWVYSAAEPARGEKGEQTGDMLHRDDTLLLKGDGTCERTAHSEFPGEDAYLESEGTWRVRGRNLHLTWQDEAGNADQEKLHVEVVDDWSIRLDGRFYSKEGRPVRRRPPPAGLLF